MKNALCMIINNILRKKEYAYKETRMFWACRQHKGEFTFRVDRFTEEIKIKNSGAMVQ